MKFLLLISFMQLNLLESHCFSQTSDLIIEIDETIAPKLPNSTLEITVDPELITYFKKTIDKSKIPKNTNCVVYVSFRVDTTGYVTNVKIIRGVNELLTKNV